MKTDELSGFAGRKAFEIAYAAYRLSAYHKNKTIAGFMEQDALALMHSVFEEDFIDARLKIRALEYTVRLGVDTGIINGNAGNMLIAELSGLQTAISKFNPGNEIDVRAIFKRQAIVQNRVSSRDVPRSDAKFPAIGIDTNGKIENGIDAKGKERQEAIVNFIRQNGNCRLKDIQEGMAGVSERTIRYDMQRLVEKKVIERVGGGGPFSFYRVADPVVPPRRDNGAEASFEVAERTLDPIPGIPPEGVVSV